MLYKVTPMMPPPQTQKADKAAPGQPGQPRKRRKTAIYDADGHEVLITLMCLKCRSMRPLAQFGLRKMADGAIRNQPWCRTCRGATGKKKDQSSLPVAAEAGPELHMAVLHAAEPEPELEPTANAPAPVAAAPSVIEIALGEPVG